MLTLYIVTAIAGGALVLASAVFGGQDVDTDHDFTHDVDMHADADADSGVDHDQDVDHGGPWLPFFSMRFWTFSLATFGLTGTLLTLMTDTFAPTVLTWAIALGLVMGLSVSILMRTLKFASADSSVSQSDLLGIEAQVTVPIRGALMGRVRCNVKGESLDLLATAESEASIEEGSKVVIVEMTDGRARVVPREDVFGKETQW